MCDLVVLLQCLGTRALPETHRDLKVLGELECLSWLQEWADLLPCFNKWFGLLFLKFLAQMWELQSRC